MSDILKLVGWALLAILLMTATLGIMTIIGYWLYCLHWTLSVFWGCVCIIGLIGTIVDYLK